VPESWYSTVTGEQLMFQQDNSDLLSAIMAKKGFQELYMAFYSTETTVNET